MQRKWRLFLPPQTFSALRKQTPPPAFVGTHPCKHPPPACPCSCMPLHTPCIFLWPLAFPCRPLRFTTPPAFAGTHPCKHPPAACCCTHTPAYPLHTPMASCPPLQATQVYNSAEANSPCIRGHTPLQTPSCCMPLHTPAANPCQLPPAVCCHQEACHSEEAKSFALMQLHRPEALPELNEPSRHTLGQLSLHRLCTNTL